jgi:MFS family permease
VVRGQHRTVTTSDKTQALIPRSMLVFLLAVALGQTTLTMTGIQIPVFLLSLGANVPQIGLFFTLSAILPLALRILGGWFSDGIGRLRAITLGSLTGVAAFIAYALSPTWTLALLGPALLAIASALILPSYKAYIADHTQENARGRLFGLSSAAINLAWIIGPPFGGFIAQNYGFRAMFFVASALFAISAAIFVVMELVIPSLGLNRDGRPGIPSLPTSMLKMIALLFSGGLITWLVVTDGIRDVAFKFSFDLMPVYLADIGHLSSQQIGLLDGIFGIVLVAAGYPAGWLADKTSERVGMVSGLASVLASRLIFVMVQGFWGFAFSWSMLALGVALMDPALQSLIAKAVPAPVLGMAYAVEGTTVGLFSLPSPWIGGQLWNLLSPRAPFLFTVALGSLALIPAWFKLVVPHRQPTLPELDTAQAD